MNVSFLEVAADWADTHAVDIKFARDEYEGWFAIIYLSDARGPFSATMGGLEPKKNESANKYRERIQGYLMRETAKARANRIRRLTGVLAASKAA